MISLRRRVAPVAIAVGVGIVVGSGGCNLVVGSSDYKVTTAGDSGVSTTPDAETTDDGATTLPPGDSGTPPGPDGAVTSESGAPPVDSGTTPPADGGPTTVCGANGTLLPNGLPTNDPAFQQLVKSCVLAVSCDPLFFDVTASDCITNDYLHAYLPSDCLSKITSCDDYFACQGSRIAKPAECQDAFAADMDIGTCNGTVATTCFGGDGEGMVWNCAAVGGTCAVFNEDDIGDTGAGCQVLSSCTDSTTDLSVHCASATQAYTCLSTETTNVGMGTQVCPQGTSCQTSNGLSGCDETTAPCTTAGSSCTNGDLTTCLSVGSANEQYTSKCSVAGLQCTAGLGTAACTAAGCSAAACTEACNGNQLQVCVGGAPFLVDCPSLGLATCNSGFNPNDDEYYFCSNQ